MPVFVSFSPLSLHYNVSLYFLETLSTFLADVTGSWNIDTISAVQPPPSSSYDHS